jgi:hypothetical protein
MAAESSVRAGLGRRGDSRPAAPHIPSAPFFTIPSTSDDPMRDLVPGGYLFTHAVFWTVVSLVAVGTNAVAIILSIGLPLLILESVTKQD